MKADSESIIRKELDMISKDKVSIRNELEDSSYGYYYADSNIVFIPNEVSIKNELEDSSYGYYYADSNIVFIPNEVGSEIIVYKNSESSNDLGTRSRPSTIQLCVTEAETEKRDIFPGKKLNGSHSGLDLELIDISEALLPYLLPAESDAETDSKNICESVNTNSKQPEHVHDSSSGSAEVDETTVDNDFPTLFREECEQQVKRQGGGDCQALKDTVAQCSAKKKARSALSAKNRAKRKGCAAKNGESRTVKQKRSRKEEIGKCISSETYICPDSAQQMYLAADHNSVQSSILSTSSRTSEGRMLCGVDSTSTNSASSSISSSSELDLMDEKYWDMFLSRKCRMKQNESMDDIQICKIRYSDNPEGVFQKKDENAEIVKSISAEISNSAQYLIPSTSSGASEGRMLCKGDSNSTSAFSSICSNSELDPIDERKGHKFLDSDSREKQKELMDDLRISVPQDNPGGIQKEMGIEVEISNLISAEADSGIEFPIPSISSENSRGRKRKVCHEEDISAFFTSPNSPEVDELDQRTKNRRARRISAKTEKELVENLRLLTPGVLYYPKSKKANILIFARDYIVNLKRCLESNRKRIKDLKKEKKSLLQKFANEIRTIPQ